MKEFSECCEFLQSRTIITPRVAFILGSGLGSLLEQVEIDATIPYREIPHFPVSTVEGHAGNLIFGTLCEVPVAIMQGRFHYYEGYSMQQIAFPVRVLKLLGVECLFLANATGGLNPAYKTGDIVLIGDHINLQFDNPLRGKNGEEFGVRFPDMSRAYDEELILFAQKSAQKRNIVLHSGVYVACCGPSLETPAEYRMFRLLGGDVVGMSSVPEVIAARHAGMRCCALAAVTNESSTAQQGVETSFHTVQENAQKALPNMTAIFTDILMELKIGS
ncbi:MAG: purine-nucleoside phosphorylase [Bacteroidales bacterium]|jgi:purine-nucleoside phosphorylase|nr:purine-nucleoside phosphorylase [Bacteroidales bacterium]